MVRRLILAAVLLFGLVISCSDTPKAPCWTKNHPDQGYKEFIVTATEIVKEKFPEWYQKDVPLGLDLFIYKEAPKRLAYTHINEEGKTAIKLTQRALDLCTAEDLAYILLHEYVHVKIWEDVETATEDDNDCDYIRHEIVANWTTLEAHSKLGYSRRFLINALLLYEKYYRKGFIFCAPEIYEDFPGPSVIAPCPS